MLSVALAILKLVEKDLLKLGLGEINDYFKSLKDEDPHSQSYKLLPDFETIINESKRINITDDRISLIMRDLNLETFQPQLTRAQHLKLQEEQETQKHLGIALIGAALDDVVEAPKQLKKKKKKMLRRGLNG